MGKTLAATDVNLKLDKARKRAAQLKNLVTATNVKTPVRQNKNSISPPHIYGVVDIGSNGIRCAIIKCSKDKNGQIVTEELLKYSEKVGLAKGLDPINPVIPDDKKTAAINAVNNIKSIFDSAGLECADISAIGTATLRAVQNSDEGKAFINNLSAQLGCPINIISGQAEGLYVANHLQITTASDPEFPDSCIMVDIGGGSAEFCLVSKNQTPNEEQIISLSLGTLALSNLNLNNEELIAHINNKLDQIPWLKDYHDIPLCFTGGCARALQNAILMSNSLKNLGNRIAPPTSTWLEVMPITSINPPPTANNITALLDTFPPAVKNKPAYQSREPILSFAAMLMDQILARTNGSCLLSTCNLRGGVALKRYIEFLRTLDNTPNAVPPAPSAKP